MSDEGAFVRAFRLEMDAAAHETLVGTYVWANSTHYGAVSAELRQRGEEWAQRIEDAGATWDVLRVLGDES